MVRKIALGIVLWTFLSYFLLPFLFMWLVFVFSFIRELFIVLRKTINKNILNKSIFIKINNQLKEDLQSFSSWDFFKLKAKISWFSLFIWLIFIILLEVLFWYLSLIEPELLTVLFLFIISLYIYIAFLFNRLNSFGYSVVDKIVFLIWMGVLWWLINSFFIPWFRIWVLVFCYLILANKNDVFIRNLRIKRK